jgi:hypothetical protein
MIVLLGSRSIAREKNGEWRFEMRLFLFFLAAACCKGQVQVIATEKVQTVQSKDNSVPLVSGKATLIRLYLGSESALQDANATLDFIGNDNRVNTLPALTSATISHPSNVDDARYDLKNTINFLLSAKASVGRLKLVAIHLKDSRGMPVACVGCTLNEDLSFAQVPPLRLKLIGISYHVPGSNLLASPRQADFDSIESWLRRAYPIPSLISSRLIVDAEDQNLSVETMTSADADGGCSAVNPIIAAMRRRDLGPGDRTHYYGVIPESPGFRLIGCASSMPQQPDPASVASGPAGTPSNDFASWGTEASYAGWYAGHELAHTFGRYHPGFCQNVSDDDPSYPYIDQYLTGRLSSSDDRHYLGLDLGPSGDTPTLLLGNVWADIMTYCDRVWPTDYTYGAIMQRLQAEANPQGPGRRRPPTQGLGITLITSVNVTKKTARVQFVGHASEPPTSPYNPASPERFAIRAVVAGRNAAGNELFAHPVRITLNSDLRPGGDQTGLIDAVVPNVPGTVRLVLIVEGTQIAETAIDRGEQQARLSQLSVTPVTQANNNNLAAFIEGLSDEETKDGLLIRWTDSSTSSSYTVQVGAESGPLQTVALSVRRKYFIIKTNILDTYRGKKMRVVVTTNGLSRSQTVSKTVNVK